MKTAQEFRAGQVANINGAPWVIQKAEFNKSDRNAAVVKMKLKNLLTGAGTETVFKADDKLEPIILDRKEVTYSYFADPLYVFMDSEFNQYEIEKDDLEGVLTFIEDGMTDICEAVFYNDKVISVELPTTIVRQIAYTEPASPRRHLGQGDEDRAPEQRRRAAGFRVLRNRRLDRDRYPHRRVQVPRQGLILSRDEKKPGIRRAFSFPLSAAAARRVRSFKPTRSGVRRYCRG